MSEATRADPSATSKAARTLPGLELLRGILAGELPPTPMGRLLGFSGMEVEEGRVLFRGEPSAEHLNPIGSIHGGYAAALLDSALGCAVHSTLPAGTGYTTLELSTNFVGTFTLSTGPVLAVDKRSCSRAAQESACRSRQGCSSSTASGAGPGSSCASRRARLWSTRVR